jgi:hypothetical protein
MRTGGDLGCLGAVNLELTAASGTTRAGLGERLAVALDAPVTVSVTVSGVPHGTVRFITDEGQTQQVILPATGGGTYP